MGGYIAPVEDFVLNVSFNDNSNTRLILKDVLMDDAACWDRDLFINPLWDIFLLTGLYPINREAINGALTKDNELHDDDGDFDPSITYSYILEGESSVIENGLEEINYKCKISEERREYIASKSADELAREFEKLLIEAKTKIKGD